MKTIKILTILAGLGLAVPPAEAAQLEIPGLAVVNAGWKLSKVKNGIDEFHVMAAFRDALDRKTFRLTVNGVDFTPFLRPAGENLSAFSLPMPVQALDIVIEGQPEPDAVVTTRQRSAGAALPALAEVLPGISAALPVVRGNRRDVPAAVRAKLPPAGRQSGDTQSP
ncbi:MAG TPA: hypothetical protein VF267_12195 [Gammaproteobacteria bacterium]